LTVAHRDPTTEALPSWAHWNPGLGRRYTLGIEEEVMLLQPRDYSLAQASDVVLARLSGPLVAHTSPETHAAVIELATGVHLDVAGAATELAALRAELVRELSAIGLVAASAGTYPLEYAGQPRVSRSARYRRLAASMRALARRDPTLALHVHVGVPDPEDAIQVLNSLRSAVPLLIALSANSPFCQGRDTGFASSRTVIFQGFPRTGTARQFAGYADYVRAVDQLIASEAVPDPSYLWWDVRIQPKLGTVEVRATDAQASVADSASLAALVQSLARSELEGDHPRTEIGTEALAENRFLAARDGMDANLIDPAKRALVPVRKLVEELLGRCRPHAASLGCSVELERLAALAEANGADRQRARGAEGGLTQLLASLTHSFAPDAARTPMVIRS
jgi:carboxylate-amine ligase